MCKQAFFCAGEYMPVEYIALILKDSAYNIRRKDDED